MRSKVAPILISTGLLALAAPGVAAAQTAVQNAYGGAVVSQQPVIQQAPPVVPTVTPAPVVLPAVDEVEPGPEAKGAPEAVAPEAASPPAEVAEQPAQVAALPFTGLELGVVAMMGFALLAAGIGGRMLVRRGVRAY
jgi:hypothetical protein